ncbi:MAG TPA: GNAT family N-acetyltransferase [Burkholderiaceae bacterium]
MKTITTPELSLEPLTVAHAEPMFGVLCDPELYRYLDYGPPPSVEHVRNVYTRLEHRQSPDGKQQWLNWVVRLKGGGLLGCVQATLVELGVAWVAYVFASTHWGRGYAFGATGAMIEHLEHAYGSNTFLATVEAENTRSIALLDRLSFHLATQEQARSHDLTVTERLFVR